MKNDSKKLIAGLLRELECHKAPIGKGLRRPEIIDGLRTGLTIPYIRNLLDWRVPALEDISRELNVSGGRVRVYRFDKLGSDSNLKKPIFAGLVLQELLKRNLDEATTVLADGGNMNSGYALRGLCSRLGLMGHYVMSRFFPSDLVCCLSRPGFQVQQAPRNASLGMEEEFYRFLMEGYRHRQFGDEVCPLWHAKNSFLVAEMLANECSPEVQVCPDTIVLSVGSGATLAFADTLLRNFEDTERRIVIAEHELSPIYSLEHEARDLHFDIAPTDIGHSPQQHLRPLPAPRVPHLVIGPHYEKKNPFISSKIEGRISFVQRYSDVQWRTFLDHLSDQGVRVGNSSCVNLMVAKHLADQGEDVVTFILEPFREYMCAGSQQDYLDFAV